MRRRGRPPGPGLLTPREAEVLSLLRLGLTNQQIADRLGISLAGAKFHVSEIISRLGVSSREEAARWAEPERRGLRAVVASLLAGKGVAVKASAAMAGMAAIGGFVLLFALALDNRPQQSDRLGKLAYIVDGNLWVRSLPSGRPLQLTSDHAAMGPKWSASGAWLSYAHGPPADPADIGPRVVRADGAGERRFEANTSLGWSPVDDVLAIALPDGTLSVENADGSGRRQLLPAVPGGGTLDRRTGLAWSRDGRWIVFEEQHQDHQSPSGGFAYVGIRAIKADGTGEHEVYSAAVPPPDTFQGIDEIPALWAGGGAPAYVALGSPAVEPNEAGRLPLDLIATLTRDEGGEDIRMLTYRDFMALSPDGRLLALVEGVALAGYPDGNTSGTVALTSVPPPRDAQTEKRIAVLDLSGGILARLTPADTVAVSPAWSPDGSEIAYVARPDTGPVDITKPADSAESSRRIWLMGRTGGDQHQLRTDGAAGCRQERPLWSAEGSSIVFACLDAELGASLWLVPAAGGNAVQVAGGIAPWSSSGPGASGFFAGYQGHIDWQLLYDYWPGRP
jgi:Tol biopolymer transport system component/DNA-binding CsgD family transcriptional regulator